MSQKFLLAWAILASALALVFLGYAIGQRSAANSQGTSRPLPALQQTDPATSSAQEPVDEYIVPADFLQLPGEWRTIVDGESFQGYAILFDPARREVIVEQCEHPGYIDRRSGATIDPGWEFCENVLWGQVVRISDQSAMVVTRDRRELELNIGVERDGENPRLTLAFDSHDMVLQPGSKNDLLQAMERSPDMVQQKKAFHQAMIAQEDARRRVIQETGDPSSATNIPAYTLPAEDDRSQDTE